MGTKRAIKQVKAIKLAEGSTLVGKYDGSKGKKTKFGDRQLHRLSGVDKYPKGSKFSDGTDVSGKSPEGGIVEFWGSSLIDDGSMAEYVGKRISITCTAAGGNGNPREFEVETL